MSNIWDSMERAKQAEVEVINRLIKSKTYLFGIVINDCFLFLVENRYLSWENIIWKGTKQKIVPPAKMYH